MLRSAAQRNVDIYWFIWTEVLTAHREGSDTPVHAIEMERGNGGGRGSGERCVYLRRGGT